MKRGTVLRDYQLEMLGRLHRAWEQRQSIMVQMPTGTGKTVLLAEVIRQELDKDGGERRRVLVVAHRRELLDQIRRTIEAMAVDTERVRVESIQKLSRRTPDEGKEEETPSLVVVDEAHHALAKTYRTLWERWPKARFLGLTATPCRMNGAAFTDLFDVLLQSWPIQEFIDKGWLSDFDYVSAAPDSRMLRQVAMLDRRGADGDYQTKEMATVMDVPESIEHLYDTYKEFADGKKGIVYAIDRQHAQHIAEYYGAHGVSCCAIDCKTPADERQRMTDDYKAGRLQVIVNVDLYSEGFDVPDMEFIQLARPTLSLSKYLQQVGRGMRTAEGKEAVLILDNVGLYQTFGLPTEDRQWQQTFYGKLAGKGQQGLEHPVVVKEGTQDEKTLVNLEMVHIRRRNESLEGLNIYLLNGRYGVMKDGKMTTRPVFERIEKTKDGLFYAIAIYPWQIFRSCKTVIDRNGRDLDVKLYGSVDVHGEFLYGMDSRGQRLVWDSIGRKYYHGSEPHFEHVAGLEMIKVGDDEYELRNAKGLHHFRFSKAEILYNRYITIIRNMLIVKTGDYRMLEISGYSKQGVLAKGNKELKVIPVTWDGQIGQQEEVRFFSLYSRPDVDRLRLRNP